MHLSLGAAARQCGFSKSTISRAIRDGKLTAERLPGGGFRIEQSELQRFVDAVTVARATAQTVAMARATTDVERPDLEAQIDGLKQVADLLRNQLTDALAQRDRWQAQAERLSLPATKTSETPAAPAKVSLWRWLRSTG